MNELFVYTDGGSRGNPGKAAIGVVLVNALGSVIKVYKERIGVSTNNIAEYKALIKGLELASVMKAKRVACFSDSQLMIKQLIGEYRVHNKVLLKLFMIIKRKESDFEGVNYSHVNRTNNFIKIADSLVNQALDE